MLVVLRALGLGDFLTAVPAYRAVARAFPEHERLLAMPLSLHPLLALLGDTFAAGVAVEPLAQLPARAHDAAIGINLHGRGPQSHRVLLDARARRLIAFAHPDIPQSASGAPWIANEHEVRRWCRMLAAAGIAAQDDDLRIDVPPLKLRPQWRAATLVHPGAASASRRWPETSWAVVARACEARGARVFFTGSSAERALAARVAELAALPPERNLAGKTSLPELAALVTHARLLMSGDTGIAHLASACGTASVTLFGPTPPTLWGPPSRARHRVLWAGRSGDPHAGMPDPGLLAIAPADVMAELETLDRIGPTPTAG